MISDWTNIYRAFKTDKIRLYLYKKELPSKSEKNQSEKNFILSTTFQFQIYKIGLKETGSYDLHTQMIPNTNKIYSNNEYR